MGCRITASFLLDVAELGRGEARLLDSLLVAAVVEANTDRFMRDPALYAAYARVDDPAPDELRRPVSISALAASLSLPFETVRRHVKQLEAEGAFVTTAQGVYVPAAVLMSPRVVSVLKARHTRLLQFYDELCAANLVESLSRRPRPADDPEAPIRAVARVLADFFFRTLEVLRRVTPDPLSAMLLLEVSRSSAEHLPDVQAEAALRTGWIQRQACIPVRVAHLSRRLGVPYETTRRHLGWLIDNGLCESVDGGVLGTEALKARPELVSVAAENLANVRRMFRQLAALEVEETGARRPDAVPAPTTVAPG